MSSQGETPIYIARKLSKEDGQKVPLVSFSQSNLDHSITLPTMVVQLRRNFRVFQILWGLVVSFRNYKMHIKRIICKVDFLLKQGFTMNIDQFLIKGGKR